MGTPQLFDTEELEAKEEANQEPEVKAEVEELPEVQEAQPEEPKVEDNDVPEKYRNKSVAELVKMHQEAEKALGKQGGEVGELRKIVDQYIQSQTVAQQTDSVNTDDDEEEWDFYTDPEKAVSKAVDKHPSIQQAKQVTQEYRRGAAMAALQQKHPDMGTIVQDPGFAEWIKSKPSLTEMFVKADQQYDVDAADALFSLWKERTGAAQQTATVEQKVRKQQAKAAQTGNVSSTPQGTSRKKTFRRSDIIKLMNSDPDRYMDMQPEIMAAYAEGRVK